MSLVAPVLVGIDVAKAELVIAVRPSGERWTMANDGTGIQTLVQRVRGHAPTLIVLEATGGYERATVAALAAAQRPVVVANPRHVRDFARAPASSPRPIGSMPTVWRSLPSVCARPRARCPTPRPRRSMGS